MKIPALLSISLNALLLTLVPHPCPAADPPASLPLWEKGAPGSEARAAEPEKIETGPGVCNVSNIHHPSITPYLPQTANATGAAILIAPGGGHKVLCLGHEGYSLGECFAGHGIAAFVMKNRLAREAGSPYSIDGEAMSDTRRALRLIRQRAASWQIDPHRLGILGFSAGGELAALAAMQSDPGQPGAADPIEQQSSRPDFQVLIYPGSSSRFTVAPGMPPVFIACGENDRPDISEGMPALYLKYKAAQVPAELHIYAKTGHGFGFRPENTTPAAAWPQRLREWMAFQGFLK
jgi:endo-1,4-beta-xylanase